MKEFSVNSTFLYCVAAIVIAFVLLQSAVFLVRAWKRARALGIEAAALKRIAMSSAVFTIAPAVAILLGVITLSKALGLPLPWLRLSVVGALTYELPAATAAATAAGASLSEQIQDPTVFSAIAWVMTLGIIPGVLYIPFLMKRIQGGLSRLKGRDEAWSAIFMDALFLGMISAFLGMIFKDIRSGLSGWIPVFVMLVSALLLALCGLIMKKFKIKWLEDFALPICMLSSMALSIPITNWLS